MRARLFISLPFLVLSVAKPSYACDPGSEGTVTVPQPQIRIESTDTQKILRIGGPLAEQIFDWLLPTRGYALKLVENGFQVRKGVNVTCTRDAAALSYSCFQEITADGAGTDFVPRQDKMLENCEWMDLRLNGPSMKTLYDYYAVGSLDTREVNNVREYIKKRPNLSCSKFKDLSTLSLSYRCSQYLSTDGYAIGTGTDPVIGSGTHPVVSGNE